MPLHYISRAEKRLWFGAYCEAHRQTAVWLLVGKLYPYRLDF